MTYKLMKRVIENGLKKGNLDVEATMQKLDVFLMADRITVEEWKKKYTTAVETARQDLLVLCEQGLMVRSMEGRKAVFRRKRRQV